MNLPIGHSNKYDCKEGVWALCGPPLFFIYLSGAWQDFPLMYVYRANSVNPYIERLYLSSIGFAYMYETDTKGHVL